MPYLGSWKIDDLLTFVLTTRDSSGAVDADAVPTYRVYEDETATAIGTGSMALLDSANTEGFYSEQLTLSAANGYEKGKCYSIYITATVSGIADTEVHTFQIEAEIDCNTMSATSFPLGSESYAADGAVPTMQQAMFMIWSFLAEKNISSTTITCKKLDGSTTAMTFTINDATTPTAVTRAT